MICYIMCILLWIAYLWLDCMVVAYAFEPRRDSVRQAGIILGLMAAQLPAAALKFLFNDNVLVRYGAMIAVGIVTVAYAAVFLKGTIGQKVLFMLCEYLTALLAEMLSIGILNKYMEQKPQLSYYTPTMVLLLSVVLTVTAIFFLIFLVPIELPIRILIPVMVIITGFTVFSDKSVYVKSTANTVNAIIVAKNDMAVPFIILIIGLLFSNISIEIPVLS